MSEWSAWRTRRRSARQLRPLVLKFGLWLLGLACIASAVLTAVKIWVAADVSLVVSGVVAFIVGGMLSVNFAGSADSLEVWGRELRNGPLHVMSGPPDTARGYRLTGALLVTLGLAVIALAATDLVVRRL